MAELAKVSRGDEILAAAQRVAAIQLELRDAKAALRALLVKA